MPKKHTPGLFKRGGIWHIRKQIFGCRLRESTGESNVAQAQAYLAKRIEDIRQAKIYGVRPKRTFTQAAIKYLEENQHKRSIRSDAGRLKLLIEHIGDLTLDEIHIGRLQGFISARRECGNKMRTINHGLKVVRRILNLAESEWMDEHNLTWLLKAPKIQLLAEPDLRAPYPLNWEEQQCLFDVLPHHLERMAHFAVNTGCRDQEICNLRWEWEQQVPELDTSVFIIPGSQVKNGCDRLVVLNDIAKSVIDSVRGNHAETVFTYRSKPLTRMLNSAWLTARNKVGLDVRVHDLKHTYGRRLRAAGVSFEDRQDLLGHKSSRITTHYSAAELSNLITAANKVCDSNRHVPVLTLLRSAKRHKTDTMDLVAIA